MPEDPRSEFPSGLDRIDLVLLDVGGPIYDDATYRDALFRAANEIATEQGRTIGNAEFQETYDAQRQAQNGSLRTAVAERFLARSDRERLSELARGYWEYPVSALHADVLPTLRELANRYRIAVVANQRGVVVDALRRDGVADYVDIWAISEIVGAEKPDPAIFQHALDEAGVAPRYAVHVGNRLDTDVRGAHRVGVRAVWVLRGEAPPDPTGSQLAEADASVWSLAELPTALARLQAES